MATSCNNKVIKEATTHDYTNALIDESSPYLLQHAHNPVNWYPWGEEALKKAVDEQKLLIISVGYAACHWCHVMEHESFEDSTVAKIMNDHFVSIKVDREERPDVDDVYMTAAQMLNGSGGWPLNAIALANGKPVFAGTYYPKDKWLNILNSIVELSKNDPKKLNDAAEQITQGINESNIITVNKNPLNFNTDDLSIVVSNGLKNYDKVLGGRNQAPKFPMPNAYEFLMKHYWLTGSKSSLNISELSLDKMAEGGIYDQLGGGFARYSTDVDWLVPHFEKMLYDNAQLLTSYAHAYQLTQKPLYRKTIEETIEFVKRELMSKDGGFYSSLDADSEGEEGKFYVWKKSEIDSILEEKEAKVFNDYYDVSKRGNWEHNNILNVVKTTDDLIKKHNVTEEQVAKILAISKEKLMRHRDTRIRPGLDDKILTSWNSLMSAGLIDAYNALGDKAYLDLAIKNADFIISNQMQSDGRLLRNYKNGKSSINAFLDDYALTAHAFLKIYEATFDKKWIDQSEKLITYSLDHFFNTETLMFNYTSDLDPDLIAQKAEYNDNVIPASNSSMARVLHKQGTLTYNRDHLKKSEQMLKNMMPQLKNAGYIPFYSNWLQLLIDHINAPYEIAIVGPQSSKLRKEMSSNYIGNSILLGTEKDENLDLLKNKYIDDDITMIYVCQNRACKLPVETVAEALKLAKVN